MWAARDLHSVSYAIVFVTLTTQFCVFDCKNVDHLFLYTANISHGCNRWRDSQSPVAILNECCAIWGLGEPIWDGNSEVTVGKVSYSLHTFGGSLPQT